MSEFWALAGIAWTASRARISLEILQAPAPLVSDLHLLIIFYVTSKKQCMTLTKRYYVVTVSRLQSPYP
jgi:hypothetical protein